MRLFVYLTISLFLLACSNANDGQSTKSASELAKTQWNKKTSEDDFTKAKTDYASIRSSNEPNVDVFGNPVYAYLNLFKPESKKKNFASIRFKESAHPIVFDTKAYSECSVGPCKVQVKFDDGKILDYEFYRNGSSTPLNVIYCCLSGGRNDFVAQAMKARKIEVRVNFYQRGYGDFKFEPTSLLEWN